MTENDIREALAKTSVRAKRHIPVIGVTDSSVFLLCIIDAANIRGYSTFNTESNLAKIRTAVSQHSENIIQIKIGNK